MKIFLTADIDIPEYALRAKLDGYALSIYAGNILSGEGYNGSYMADLRALIKKYGKPVNLALIFGMYSTDTIYDNHSYLTFTRKHHRDPANPPVSMKIPVPYAKGYLQKLYKTIKFFATELRKDAEVDKLVELITITGENSATKETVFQPTDFPTPETTEEEAYMLSAEKWLGAKYTVTKAYDAVTNTIDLFAKHFPDKKLIFAPIPLLNSYPCIDEKNKIVLPKNRPDITSLIMDYGKDIENFYSQYSAFTATTITKSEYVQSNELFHSKSTLAEYEGMIQNAEQSGKLNLEVHRAELLRFPSVFYG